MKAIEVVMAGKLEFDLSLLHRLKISVKVDDRAGGITAE
jgi:hypothetical protein